MWGLAFKPNTDDMREASRRRLLEQLWNAGARVQAFDPEGRHEAGRMLKDIDFKANAYEAAHNADVVVILTEWDQFRALDLARLKLLMRAPILVDLRNVYRPELMDAHGISYVGIGRAAIERPLTAAKLEATAPAEPATAAAE